MSKNDVVGLLSRLTIHVDEELKRSVSYTPWLYLQIALERILLVF